VKVLRAWCEINLDDIKQNVKKIQELSNGREVMGIIKADAYGLGAIEVGHTLKKAGINIFGVACIDEAIELLGSGIEGDILILGGVYNEELKEASKLGFHVTVGAMEQLQYIEKNKIKTKVHIKIDTGMGRVGFTPEEGMKAIEKFRNSNFVEIVGVFTHLSVSDENTESAKEFTLSQIKKFKPFQNLEFIKYRHVLNSGGIINYHSEEVGNMVRAGILLYGIYDNGPVEGMKRAFTLKSKILFLKVLHEEMEISYGRQGKGHVGEMIATVSIGYADGLKRQLSNVGSLKVAGYSCPIVGKICMDMCMIKIPNELRDKIKVGDSVEVIGEDLFEKTKLLNGSVYDILTGIGRRVPRVYIKEKLWQK
jgi:alanine racemase